MAYGNVFYLSGAGLTNVIQFMVPSGALQLLYSQPVTPDVGVAVPEAGGGGILVGGPDRSRTQVAVDAAVPGSARAGFRPGLLAGR